MCPPMPDTGMNAKASRHIEELPAKIAGEETKLARTIVVNSD